MDIHKAEKNIKTVVNVESDIEDWCPDYEEEILEHAVTMWIASRAILPPTLEETINRDPHWDKECAKMRHMLQFQLDGLGD